MKSGSEVEAGEDFGRAALSSDFDWAGTPLGSMETWSTELRQAVDRQLADRLTTRGLTSAAVLDALFSSAPLGLAIWDRDLRFIRVNDSLAKMNGLTQEQHIGRSPAELLPGLAGIDDLMASWREMLETGFPLFDVEVTGATHAAGDRRSWNEHFFPIRLGSDIVGIGAIVDETTERRRVESALAASETRFREFAEASTDILWLRNVDTAEFEFLSGTLRAAVGANAPGEEARGAKFNWLDAVLPEDRAAAMTELQPVLAGKRVTHSFRLRMPGQSRTRWIKNTAFPLMDSDGVIRRIGGIAQDVTEEYETDQHLRLLIGELQHRTRNLMGVVQAIAESTLETSVDLDSFGSAFRTRVEALSRVQNLLSRLTGSERISFDELLTAEFDAFGAHPKDDPRVTIEGPSGVPLRSSSVQTLALAIHELTTNAIKHGALAQPAGQLAVRWHRLEADEQDTTRLLVTWRETINTVPVSRPDHRGQGRELIEFGLPHQLGAKIDYSLTDEGVSCSMTLPIVFTPS